MISENEETKIVYVLKNQNNLLTWRELWETSSLAANTSDSIPPAIRPGYTFLDMKSQNS